MVTRIMNVDKTEDVMDSQIPEMSHNNYDQVDHVDHVDHVDQVDHVDHVGCSVYGSRDIGR